MSKNRLCFMRVFIKIYVFRLENVSSQHSHNIHHCFRNGTYLGGACIRPKNVGKLFEDSDIYSQSRKKYLDRYDYLWFATGDRSRMKKKRRSLDPKFLFRLYNGLWEHIFRFIKLKKLDYVSLHISYKHWAEGLLWLNLSKTIKIRTKRQ